MGVVSESVVQQSHGPKNRSELGTNNQISARVSSSSALWFGLLHPHRTCAFPVSEPYITSNARASDIAHAGAPRATSALPPRAFLVFGLFFGSTGCSQVATGKFTGRAVSRVKKPVDRGLHRGLACAELVNLAALR